MKLRQFVSACLLGLITFCGCSDTTKEDVTEERLKAMAGGQLKEAVPVKGVVNVDGSPAEGVNIYLYREDNLSAFVSECRTDKEGKYCWSTNLSCDGVEPGKYLVGFTFIPKPKKNDTGVDLFKGKYKNPKKNKFELTVATGAPQESLNYDLKLK